jgi:hypothetical protein
LPDPWDAQAEAVVEVSVAVDRVTALVDEGVVAGAEQDEVVEGCLSTMGPVLDVVRVDEPLVLTAGKRQPRSRASSARRSAGGIARVDLVFELSYAQPVQISHGRCCQHSQRNEHYRVS